MTGGVPRHRTLDSNLDRSHSPSLRRTHCIGLRSLGLTDLDGRPSLEAEVQSFPVWRGSTCRQHTGVFDLVFTGVYPPPPPPTLQCPAVKPKGSRASGVRWCRGSCSESEYKQGQRTALQAPRALDWRTARGFVSHVRDRIVDQAQKIRNPRPCLCPNTAQARTRCLQPSP